MRPFCRYIAAAIGSAFTATSTLCFPVTSFEFGAPKARKNKAQGGRASEASSETLGSDGRNIEPCKGGTFVSPLQGSHSRIILPRVPALRACTLGFVLPRFQRWIQMPDDSPVTGCLIQHGWGQGYLSFPISLTTARRKEAGALHPLPIRNASS
jgi:hypothetical protein